MLLNLQICLNLQILWQPPGTRLRKQGVMEPVDPLHTGAIRLSSGCKPVFS